MYDNKIKIKPIVDKISKIADWIINESNSSADNIDDDYNDVLDVMYNRKEV